MNENKVCEVCQATWNMGSCTNNGCAYYTDPQPDYHQRFKEKIKPYVSDIGKETAIKIILGFVDEVGTKKYADGFAQGRFDTCAALIEKVEEVKRNRDGCYLNTKDSYRDAALDDILTYLRGEEKSDPMELRVKPCPFCRFNPCRKVYVGCDDDPRPESPKEEHDMAEGTHHLYCKKCDRACGDYSEMAGTKCTPKECRIEGCSRVGKPSGGGKRAGLCREHYGRPKETECCEGCIGYESKGYESWTVCNVDYRGCCHLPKKRHCKSCSHREGYCIWLSCPCHAKTECDEKCQCCDEIHPFQEHHRHAHLFDCHNRKEV